MPGSAELVSVDRSGLVEAVHLGSIAVSDAEGRLVASAGDPRSVCFARSTTKPYQTAISLSLMGEGPTEPEIALMCASHNGEDVHLREVRRLLTRAGLDAEALRCPPALPGVDVLHAGAERPRRELHNCSGKHAGMLLACVRAGLDPATYPDPGHPLQLAVLDLVAAAAGAAPRRIGVDGCGVPVHAFELRELATAYARLVRPEGLGSAGDHVARAAAAMSAEPYLLAGRARLCTEVMTAVPGVIVKIGAEGLICAAVRTTGLGIALKIDDGAHRARGPALIRTLEQLEVLSTEEREALEGIASPPVLGGERPVGALRAAFELRRA